MQFLIFRRQRTLQITTSGYRCSSLVWKTVHMTRFGCYVPGRLKPKPAVLHMKPPEYERDDSLIQL